MDREELEAYFNEHLAGYCQFAENADGSNRCVHIDSVTISWEDLTVIYQIGVERFKDNNQ